MSRTPVTAVIPGIIYLRPGPGKDAYAQAGDVVAQGQVLGLMEIMKQFAEITAPVAGTLVEFHVADGDVLAPGQTIAEIETE